MYFLNIKKGKKKPPTSFGQEINFLSFQATKSHTKSLVCYVPSRTFKTGSRGIVSHYSGQEVTISVCL